MNDLPRQILCEIISQNGKTFFKDTVALRGLLDDLCHGDYKKERRCIIDSIAEGIPPALLDQNESIPYDILSAQLTNRLINCGFEAQLARWSVDSWAIALDVLPFTDVTNKKFNYEKETSVIKTNREPLDGFSTPPKKINTFTPPPVSTPQTNSGLPNTLPKNQTIGRYKQKKFILYLAGVCFATPWILAILFQNYTAAEPSGLISTIIGLSVLIGWPLSIVLLVAYWGYIFKVNVPAPQTNSGLPNTLPKNQIRGKYKQNKFILLLAGICFATPWILALLFPNAHTQPNGLINLMIGWTFIIGTPASIVLFAAYKGYIFKLKK
jgi:hypothetical protein